MVQGKRRGAKRRNNLELEKSKTSTWKLLELEFEDQDEVEIRNRRKNYIGVFTTWKFCHLRRMEVACNAKQEESEEWGVKNVKENCICVAFT